ncbi:MAG: TraB/GumN family protein [Sphingomonadales bacterium]
MHGAFSAIRVWCVALVALFTVTQAVGPAAEAQAQSGAQAQNSGPAIWTAKGEAGTVHFFGSMHLLKEGVDWRTPAVDRALGDADQIVLEIRLDEDGEDGIRRFMMQRGYFGQGESLKTALPEDVYDDLIAAAAEFNVPEHALAQMRPWHAALMIGMMTMQQLGFDPSKGVEHGVMEVAEQRGVPVSGLETPHEQLSTMADQPADVQEAMVRDALRQLHDIEDMLDELTAAWLAGNESALEELLIGSFETYPELYEAVLVERNRRWMPDILALLDQPGTHLVVVGSAHLVGDDSVIAMLREAGVEVERR